MNQPQLAVLLVDCDLRMRQLRQTIFTNREIDVRLAVSLPYAHTLCRAQRYDLVLLSGHGSDEVSRFCENLWETLPKQRIALLVGPPTYLREMRAKRHSAPRESTQRIQPVESGHEPSHQWDHLSPTVWP
jgi:hypothetical protein